MRSLRLLLAGTVILALLGLAGSGPTMAADDSCPANEKALKALHEAKDQFWLDVLATEADVVNLEDKIQRLELELEALRRQRAEAATRESAALERWDDARRMIIRCTGATRTLQVDGLAEPLWKGTNIHYTVRCQVTSNETGGDASPPHRHANNALELLLAIKNMPNGCASNDAYTANLMVDVLAKDTNEVLETVGRDTVAIE